MSTLDHSPTANQEALLRLQNECLQLRQKLEIIKKFAQGKAGHKLMQIAGPFRELLNLLK